MAPAALPLYVVITINSSNNKGNDDQENNHQKKRNGNLPALHFLIFCQHSTIKIFPLTMSLVNSLHLGTSAAQAKQAKNMRIAGFFPFIFWESTFSEILEYPAQILHTT